MRLQLTLKQRHFLDYLKKQIADGGHPPSLREAAVDIGVSHAAIAQMIKVLETKGYLKRKGRYSRTLYLLNEIHESTGLQRWREIPIIGKVTAGLPMYAQQEWAGSTVADGNIYHGQNLFALRIEGNSMIGAGILDGDLAICEPRQYAVSGEIVVALIKYEEATVKRFFLHDNHIELQPENKNYESINYRFNEILIQGKVVGIQRGPEAFH